MTLIATLGLVLAALVALAFNAMVYGPIGGGDAVVGKIWGQIYLASAFFVLMAAVVGILAIQGGAQEISEKRFHAFAILCVGLFAAVVVMTLSALFRLEPRPPFPFGFYGAFATWMIPALLILLAVFRLYEPLRSAVPIRFTNALGIVTFGLSALGLLGGLLFWFATHLERSGNRAQEASLREDRIHADHLRAIEACDVQNNLHQILGYTDRYHDPDVRGTAMTKIKSRADFETVIAGYLGGPATQEAFVFVASNDVSDPSKFEEPIRKGILRTADWVRKTLQTASHESNLYADQFGYEVDRILWTSERHRLWGPPFLTALKDLRSAFDATAGVQKPTFTCVRRLDQWIRDHE